MKSTFLAIAFAIGIVLSGCAREGSQDTTPDVRVDVKTTAVRLGSIDEVVTATGSTAIQREAQLRSPITGVLIHFEFYNGDRLNKGDVVAEVRSKESQAAIQGAETMLHSATSQSERDDAEKALRLAQESSTMIAVRAPYDGILNNRSKNEMEFVSEGEQIATLIDPTSTIFVADVHVTHLSSIHEGQRVRIRFAGRSGAPIEASVHRVEPLLNPNDQTARVQIVFPVPKNGVEGSMFGEAEIIVGRHEKGLLVPVASLLRDDETNTTNVILVGADSLAHRVSVAVAARHDSLAEISATGIIPGAMVIVEGQYGLADSTRVRILP